MADSEDIRQSTVYEQLLKIKAFYQEHGSFEITCMESHVNTLNRQKSSRDQKRSKNLQNLMKSDKFIYTIRLSHELCSYLAEEMNLEIFNKKHNFQTKFKASHQKFYEPFRDIQKQ